MRVPKLPKNENSYWKFFCSLTCDFYTFTFWNDNICVHPRSISVDHHIRIQICINWISCKSVTLIWILISFDFLHRKSVANFCSVKINIFQNTRFEQKFETTSRPKKIILMYSMKYLEVSSYFQILLIGKFKLIVLKNGPENINL